MKGKQIDEYVGEKAEEIINKTSDKDFSYSIRLANAEDIVRSIIKDWQPRVSREWMNDFVHDTFCFDLAETYTLGDFLYEKLTEAGVEIEDK